MIEDLGIEIEGQHIEIVYQDRIYFIYVISSDLSRGGIVAVLSDPFFRIAGTKFLDLPPGEYRVICKLFDSKIGAKNIRTIDKGVTVEEKATRTVELRFE